MSVFRLGKERDTRHPWSRGGQALMKSNREAPRELKQILSKTLKITVLL